MVKRILKLLFSRMAFFIFALLIQLTLFGVVIARVGNPKMYFNIYIVCQIVSIISVVYIINGKSNPGYKMAWIITVLVIPIFGLLIYFAFGRSKFSFFKRRRMQVLYENMRPPLAKVPDLSGEINASCRAAGLQSRYITDYTYCPPYANTESEYFPSGELMFSRMLADLEAAEHFIFMEYFIIGRGEMWDTILDILKRKAAAGVDVRLMYDDIGTMQLLPYQYDRTLSEAGIRCRIFNPVVPVLSASINNRNHRKITVIDGHIAYTGGINLADEYINKIERFGYWKDSAIRLHGEGVWSFTLMFLTMWEYWDGVRENYSVFRPSLYMKDMPRASGYVQPYADNPLDTEPAGETVYLNMINRAEQYIYITTPYLIVDNELITALCCAAKSGVDVRIITPGIPDKWYIHVTSRAYYEVLLEAGVRVYEYTPGFIHAKNFVCDDKFATVGSINLDYRSLYLHFECGVWMYKTDSIPKIKEDFVQTLSVCRECTLKETRDVRMATRVFRSIMRAFAPLL